MARDLIWPNLRSHEGKHDASFEQLCSILWRLEGEKRKLHEAGAVFVRNGRPDGGVEAYWHMASGEVHGIQAKYFREPLGASQFAQLDESMEHALEGYPTLTRFVVCVPRELSDNRKLGQQTERVRWNAWVGKWRRRRRRITIELWDTRRLATELSVPGREGLLKFFFDASVLSAAAVQRHVDEQIARAGPRFHPNLHVGHPLEQMYEWIVWPRTLIEPFRRTLGTALQVLDTDSAVSHLAAESDFLQSRTSYGDAVRQILKACETPALDGLSRAVSDSEESATSLSWAIRKHIWDERTIAAQPGPPNPAAALKKRDDLQRLYDRSLGEANRVWPEREHGWWDHAQRRIAVVVGEGGCGKTHLSCEIARRYARQGRPVVLAFGQSLDVNDLWAGLMKAVPGFGDRDEFLSALDSAGEIAECRTLLIIDAMNEAERSERWPQEIAALAQVLSNYPHIAAVLTVRDVYWHFWSRAFHDNGIPDVEHDGFESDPIESVSRYFDYYNIVAPEAPPLHPEFYNPLFLSVFCQSLAGQPDPGHRRPPVTFAGKLDGLSAVFDAFVDRRNTDLVQRYGLDTDLSPSPLRAAVGELAERMSESPQLSVSIETAKEVLARHLRSPRLPPDLVRLAEGEGLIHRFPYPLGDDRYETRVGFAYDRFGAYLIVDRWLGAGSTVSDAAELFDAGGHLSFKDGKPRHPNRYPSLAAAAILQWPERFGHHLFDDRPELLAHDWWAETFLDSFPLGSAAFVTGDTNRLVKSALDVVPLRHARRAAALRRMLCHVGHPSVVEGLHNYLAPIGLAERDSWWTVDVERLLESLYGPIGPLLEWPLRRPGATLDTAAALAYTTRLAWFTGMTNRAMRARATEAMAAVLERQLRAAPELLRRFAHINDPYIVQSVTLAVYGAALRTGVPRLVRQAAEEVLRLFPAKVDFPVDIVGRHALSGIVEWAKHLDPSLSVDLEQVRPPYQSKWISTAPSWSVFVGKEKGRWKRSRAFSTLVGSCWPETSVDVKDYRGYGDFGRYVVSSACGAFFDYSSEPDRVPRPFVYDLPHRFILHRVLALGWTPARFEEFDAGIPSTSRYKNDTERIGKKYQWIALSEFLARAADHFPIVTSDWPKAGTRPYAGPWDVATSAPIDPSLLHQAHRRSKARHETRSASVPFDPGTLWSEPNESRWLLTRDGFPDPRDFLLLAVREGHPPAALLAAFLSWRQPRPDTAKSEEGARKIWMHVQSFAVRESDFAVLRAWVQSVRGPGQIVPDLPRISGALFGELYWSRAARSRLGLDVVPPIDPWHVPGRYGYRGPCPLLPLATSYSNEYDETERNVHALLPGKWITDQMALRAGPSDLTFTDAEGNTATWNVGEEGNDFDAVFCDRGRLSNALSAATFKLVWLVTAEKWVLSDKDRNTRPSWPWFKGLYWLERGKVAGLDAVQFDARFPIPAARTKKRRSRRGPKPANAPARPAPLRPSLTRMSKKRQRNAKRVGAATRKKPSRMKPKNKQRPHKRPIRKKR